MMPSNVSSVVDAYRGREPELMQRYQNSQELIYLLALQKLKSEKEAAMRDIQMKMNPQGEPPTIAQQRENEVRDLSVKELATQSAGAMQQRQAQLQDAQRNMLARGLAAAPGAQNAGQMLAGGGIVAFNGEEDGSYVDPQAGMSMAQRADDYMRRHGSIYRTVRSDSPTPTVSDDQLAEQAKREISEMEAGTRVSLSPNVEVYMSKQRGDPNADYLAREQARNIGRSREIARSVNPVPGLPPMAREDQSGAIDAERAGIPAALAAPSRQKPPPPPPPPTAGEPPASAAAPEPAGPALPRGSAAEDAYNAYTQAQRGGPHGGIQSIFQTDPQATFERLQNMYPAMSQDDLKARTAAIEQMKKDKAAEFDPKKQALAGLARFLLGAAGRTRGQEFAGAGAAGLNYLEQQAAAERERGKEIRGEEEKLRSAQEAERRAAFEAGLAGLKEAGLDRRSGMAALANLYGTDVGAASHRYTADLHLEGVRLATEAKKVENDLTRRNLDLTQAMRQYEILSTRRADLREKTEKRLDAATPIDIKILQSKSQRTPQEERVIQNYNLAREEAIQQTLAETNNALSMLEAKLNIPLRKDAAPKIDTSGFSIQGVRPGK